MRGKPLSFVIQGRKANIVSSTIFSPDALTTSLHHSLNCSKRQYGMMWSSKWAIFTILLCGFFLFQRTLLDVHKVQPLLPMAPAPIINASPIKNSPSLKFLTWLFLLFMERFFGSISSFINLVRLRKASQKRCKKNLAKSSSSGSDLISNPTMPILVLSLSKPSAGSCSLTTVHYIAF
jgi:hypothetical protein